MLRDKLFEYAHKRKTIELKEIKALCSAKEKDELYLCISTLVNDSILSPVKSSGTDGNRLNPLYLKYRIVPPKEDLEQYLAKIRCLHPKLIANGYLLKKPEEYKKRADFISRLNSYISSPKDSYFMSRRERSLIIFGDEKALDNNLSFISSLGLSGEDLFYYATPEQCFADYIPKRTDKMVLLICENKDIWFNIRRLMFEDNRTNLFGTHIDGVIFGDGNEITGRGKFSGYAEYLHTKAVVFLYCGDIDRAGFDIYLRLKREAENLDISLFVPIYKKMLELFDIDALPDSDDKRNFEVDMTEIFPLFTEQEQKLINYILERGKRLPQEIINYHILCDNMG